MNKLRRKKDLLLQQILLVVIDQKDNIVSLGFRLENNIAVTCWHGIQHMATEIGQIIHIKFPFISEQTYIAQLIFCDREIDLVGLEITTPLPVASVTASLNLTDNFWEHKFRTFGFPKGYPHGIWSHGILRDRNTKNLIQMETESNEGYLIRPGFSGAPVWDLVSQQVLGIVVEVDTEYPVAYMLPSSEIKKKFLPFLLNDDAPISEPSVALENESISIEAPLLIGVILDFSSALLRLFLRSSSPKEASVEKMEQSLKLLKEKALAYCQTPEAKDILPLFSIFIYAYGLGKSRRAALNVMQRIGLRTVQSKSYALPEEAVRDLFAENANKLQLPLTPDIASLHKNWQLYSESVNAQRFDIGTGESSLIKCLQATLERFQVELNLSSYYKNPLLLIISTGETDENQLEIDQIVTQLKELGIEILCGYLGQHNVTQPKTLYAHPEKFWPESAIKLWKCSSSLSGSNPLGRAILDWAVEHDWQVPENAKLFMQVNQSEILSELIDFTLSPLKRR